MNPKTNRIELTLALASIALEPRIMPAIRNVCACCGYGFLCGTQWGRGGLSKASEAPPVGIGVVLHERPDGLFIADALHDGPAARAGLRPGTLEQSHNLRQHNRTAAYNVLRIGSKGYGWSIFRYYTSGIMPLVSKER